MKRKCEIKRKYKRLQNKYKNLEAEYKKLEEKYKELKASYTELYVKDLRAEILRTNKEIFGSNLDDAEFIFRSKNFYQIK